MKKRAFLLVIIIIIFIFISIKDISSLRENGGNKKISEEVYSSMDSKEGAKVYIKFKQPSEIEVGRKLFSFHSRNISTVKEEVKSLITKEKIRHDFGDKISAYLKAEEIEKLANISEIKNIEIVRERKIFLQDSINVINASDSHKLAYNGLNLTGAGRTICLIDTGVNSSHPALGGCYGNNDVSSGCKVIGGWDYCADNAECGTMDSNPDDINGHGTHVAGIAAANRTITGTAPEARIVMLKACNSTGSCFDDDISASINWCIGNASTYNISVISMSLGSGLYSNYCNNDPLANDINNVIGSNLPVVIAAGNNGNTSYISAPACVENATAVGSIRKDDLTLDYNRNSLVQLLAPGYSINSTCLSSASSTQYCINSGTSMATPHVAGAIAILAEYLNLTQQVRTPSQIKSLLNSSGKQVYDSGSNLNYSRINLFSALVALDNGAPNVSLISPGNNTAFMGQNITFICNATDLALKNVTFYLWNSTNTLLSLSYGEQIGLANSSTQNVSGSAASSAFTIRNLSVNDSYNWNCQYSDYNNLIGYSPVNYTLSISTLEVSLSSPENNKITNQNQTYTCNATSTGALQNVTFYLWNSTGLVNITNASASGVSGSFNFSYNFTYDDSYKWNCLYTNTNNAINFASANFSITYDITTSSINVSSPLNSSWHNIGRFNVTLNENGSCVYSLDNGNTNYSMSSLNNRNFNASNLTLADNQTYHTIYYCNDSAGNLNMTKHFTFNSEMSAPNVSLISPADRYSISASSSEITFEYNASDGLNISSCSLIIDNKINLTNSSIANQTVSHNFTQTLAAATYNWNINCTDLAGNIGNSSFRTLTITAPASTQGSDGGGGGGGGGGAAISSAKIYSPSQENLNSGYKQELKEDDKIKITLFDEKFQNHTLSVENIGKDFVNLTIRSKPINFLLGVGQSIKLNLTSPKYYNLFIKLEEIKIDADKKKRAILAIQSIKEEIPAPKEDKKTEKEKEEENKITEESTSGISFEEKKRFDIIYIYWLTFAAALVGLIVHLIDLRKERKEQQGKSYGKI